MKDTSFPAETAGEGGVFYDANGLSHHLAENVAEFLVFSFFLFSGRMIEWKKTEIDCCGGRYVHQKTASAGDLQSP
ncbi:MAG: hypothetical protein IJ210_14455 [Clostridia bacterium]|nr:hypothetical protein [Clostridia bacterium]